MADPPKIKRGQSREHMLAIASRGGQATAAKKGHLQSIATLGGQARAKACAAKKGKPVKRRPRVVQQDPPPLESNPVAASIDKMLAEIEAM